MIYRAITILFLLSLLAACGVPAEPTNVADQPAASPTSAPSVTPAPSTTPPPRPTLVPAAPTETLPPTWTPAPPAATSTAPAVTPTTTPVMPSTPTTIAPTVSASGILTGTISYLAETLPANAKLTVRLIGIPGFGSVELGRQEFAPVPAGPVAFALRYDAAQVNPIDYPIMFVEAAIESDGIVVLDHEPANVLTQGAPTTVDMTLTPSTRAVVSGAISYPSKQPLPADATLMIWLALSPETLPHAQGEQIITPAASGSTRFVVQSSYKQTKPGDTYQLYAALRGGGKLLFVTNQILPVTLKDYRAAVDLTLEPPAQVGAFSGTVSYTGIDELPDDAVLTVQLNDVSYADGPAALLGEQSIAPVGPGPIPFMVEYDQRMTRDTARYAVSAQVVSGEKLLLSSTMLYEVQPGDATPLTIEMQPVGR